MSDFGRRMRRHAAQGKGAIAVGWLTAGLVALAFCATFFNRSPVTEHEASVLGWAAFAAAYAASEMFLIHFPTRRDTQSVSFSEIPLVLGFFFLSPAGLVATAVTGSAIALVFHRRQRGMKLAFNLASIAAQTAVASAVFDLVTQDHSLELATALAAVTAALVADLLAALFFDVAIGLFRGARPEFNAWNLIAGAVAVVSKTGLALVGFTSTQRNGVLGLVLVVLVAFTMYYAFNSYAHLHARHLRLEKLYRFDHAVAEKVHLEGIGRAVVRATGELLHAGRVTLELRREDGSLFRWYDSEGDLGEAIVMEVFSPDEAAPLTPGEEVSGGRIEAPLVVHAGVSGRLVAEQPETMEARFDSIDEQLLMAMAARAGNALDNGMLVERIEAEMLQRAHRASHDDLTGLPNRSGFLDILDRMLVSPSRPHTVLVMGVNRFSDINKTLGHDTGDAVLREVTTRLGQVAPHALVARLGSDEFAALIPDDLPGGEVMVRTMAAPGAPLQVGALQVELTMSVGVAGYPEHGLKGDEVLRCAELAMRHAKLRRSLVQYYEAEDEIAVQRRMTLAHSVRDAVHRGEISLHYQPKVDLDECRVVGVEALARWTHPQLGSIPPDEFVVIAEQVGAVETLTRFVLDAALAQRNVWLEQGVDLAVAVNISAQSLSDAHFSDRIERVLVRHRCPVDRLVLEITETQLMSDPERASDVLTRLHHLGVHIAVDDFGTGFSSLSLLRQLPVDELKIDKSFVIDVMGNLSDSSIVRSTATLARSLGLHVVAEGVESAEALEFLRTCGVDSVQGYFFSRPLPANEITSELIARLDAQAAEALAAQADHTN